MTKEEFLKKHTDKYLSIRIINKSIIGEIAKSIHAAMEEYAKQEVLAFLNHNVYSDLTEIQFEDIWNQYQFSKLKK